MLAKRLTNVQSLIPSILSLPLQAEDGKDRHKAWLMLTTAAMWKQRGGRVEVRRDATGRLADKWDHSQQLGRSCTDGNQNFRVLQID